MRRILRMFMVSTVILTLISTSAWAVNADYFSISKKLGYRNVNPGVARNTSTGEVLAVWAAYDDTSSASIIYCAKIALKNGKPKVYKAIPVSANDGTYGRNSPDVTYHSSTNSYFVVWSTSNDEEAGVYVDLHMREVNAAGKPVGKVMVLLSDAEIRNSDPKILPHYLYGAAAGKDEKPQLIICWSSQKYSEPVQLGMAKAVFDTSGNLVSPAEIVLHARVKTGNILGQVAPLDMIQSYTDGSYYIVTREWEPKENLADSISHAAVVQLNNNSRLKGIVPVISNKRFWAMRIAQAGNNLFVASFLEDLNKELQNQAIKPKPRKSKKLYVPFESPSTGFAMLPLETGGFIQVNANFQAMQYARFDARGKMGEILELDLATNGYDMVAEWIGTGESFVAVYIKDLAINKSEIAGSVITLEK